MNRIWLANTLDMLDHWLDENVASEYKQQPMAQDWARISKVAEELGEAIAAFIGVTGQNPRKGITHTPDQVVEELADVALTALVAIQHFTKDGDVTVERFRERIEKVLDRIDHMQQELDLPS